MQSEFVFRPSTAARPPTATEGAAPKTGFPNRLNVKLVVGASRSQQEAMCDGNRQ